MQEPLARVDRHGEHADIFWYHTELNGLPDSVTDSNGDTVWRGASTAWGRSLRESTPVTWDTSQNLRFQGQYLDRETGLHYNTFRYYDPAGGCYTQMDPIGLAGGLNTYTYVVDPLGWVDPLGLFCGVAKKAKWNKARQNIDGPGLRDHYEKHGSQVGATTTKEYDYSARQTIQNGRKFTYRDRYTNKPRIGYYDPEKGLFTATSQTGKTPVILTHFPETWENLRKLPGFSVPNVR